MRSRGESSASSAAVIPAGHTEQAPSAHDAVFRALLDSGVLTEGDLRRAEERNDGLPVAEFFLRDGTLTREQLTRVLARLSGVEYVDLRAQPADERLVRSVAPEAVVARHWLPWRERGDGAIIVTSKAPTEQLVSQAGLALGMPVVDVRIATDTEIERLVSRVFGPELAIQAADGFADAHPAESARGGLTWWQRALPPVVVAMLVAVCVFDLTVGVFAIVALANAVLFALVAMKVLAGLGTVWVRLKDRRRGRRRAVRYRSPDHELPVYTILVPAYREANVIGRLLENIDRIDYPRAKLDVILLLEEDDVETVDAVRRAHPPSYVRTLVVPSGEPQTKPRACNFGLRFARGTYVVIYDAEDRPEPGQLRAAVEAFERPLRHRRDARPLGALQCGLHYFNAHHNLLTRLFAIEYAFWFDAMLPGLQRSRMPLPLGGTSNHFRTHVLREVGGWDAYNVTEDADLGLRVASRGYRIDVLDSSTWEEACSRVPAWIRQRTRWTKGYMMTGAVSTRHPVDWVRRNGVRGIPSLALLIGGTPLAFMLYPLLLVLSGLLLLELPGDGVVLPMPFVAATFAFAALSHVAMICASFVSAWMRYDLGVAWCSLLLPVYWLLHSVAAYRALWQLYLSPFHWEKTPHGIGGVDEQEALDVERAPWPMRRLRPRDVASS